KGDGGFVLTMTARVSPARMEVWEQYPSIHGQRYFVWESTRVLMSSQSVVPALSFSPRITSRRAGAAGRWLLGTNAAAKPAPATSFSNWRRLIRDMVFSSMGLVVRFADSSVY